MPTLTSQVRDRINGAGLGFKHVAMAVDLKTVLTTAPIAPSCFIYRYKNVANPNEVINRVRQKRTQSIALLVVTQNVRDANGGDNAEDNERYCDLIEGQLLGFTADERYFPMEYVSGDLVLLRNGFHYWREIYQSARFIGNR